MGPRAVCILKRDFEILQRIFDVHGYLVLVDYSNMLVLLLHVLQLGYWR